MKKDQDRGQQARLSVSTWSLHRALGTPQFYGVDKGQAIPIETHGRGALSLLEVPERVATAGIRTLEICHFHLPSLDKGYLTELRAAVQDADVELFSLLIDDGDITDRQHGERDLAWIESWVEVASVLGAKRARVIAGKAEPGEATIEMSIRGLSHLVQRAEDKGLRLMTENWFGLFSRPVVVKTVLERLEGRVGLCLDFGNWKGPTKYDDLRAIAAFAESCHAKAQFAAPQEMDREDFVRCLEITRTAHFAGPYTLIYDGPDTDEWAGLAKEREVVLPYLQ